MSAELNLVPNPIIIAIQAGIFFTSIGVVQKFYLVPYQKLRKKRENATVGSKDLALLINKKNEEIKAVITAKMTQAVGEARNVMESASAGATKVRDEMVARASSEANDFLSGMRSETKQQLEREASNLRQSVEVLAGQIIEKVLVKE